MGPLKNHYYINGAQIQIECFTDHNPLVNIENKDLSEVTNNRELKLLESRTPYNIKVKHIPADKNTFADALSRLPSKTDTIPPHRKVHKNTNKTPPTTSKNKGHQSLRA